MFQHYNQGQRVQSKVQNMMRKTTGGAAMPQRIVWKGWVEQDGKRFYAKSNWERRYAKYLSLLKKHKHIIDYHYEPKIFYFEGIKRGTNSYTPDFLIEWSNGTKEWHEVKGYETDKDRTKYKRMAKYYPEEKLRVIGKDWFKANGGKLKGIINDW